MSLPSLPSLACRWLVAAVAAAGDGQNILPMKGILPLFSKIFYSFIIDILIKYFCFKNR
jgi:hypothetical protein